MRYMLKASTRLVAIIVFGALLAAGGSGLFKLAAFAATSPTLGAAASFAILAGTPNITNVPTSDITGDVGLSPATGAGIGLTCAEVDGTIYSVDAAGPPCRVTNSALLTTAKSNLVSAYNALSSGANAACTTNVNAVQDLTLVSPLGPGVYCADAFIMTGDLALSGSGVWIFRSDSTLTTAVGSSVTGGDPCNVWWQIGSSADLFTDTTFVGNILALTSINLQNGASVSGRALARNGAVTLNANTITVPDCDDGATPTPTPAPPGASPPGGIPSGDVISGEEERGRFIGGGIFGDIDAAQRNRARAAASVPTTLQPPVADAAVRPPSTGDAGLASQDRVQFIAPLSLGLASLFITVGVATSRRRHTR